MKAKTPLLLAGLVATAFAGCLDDGSSLVVDGPNLESGYSYAYVQSMTIDVVASENGEADNAHEELPPFARLLEVVNTTQVAGDEPLFLFIEESQLFQVLSESDASVPVGANGRYVSALRQRDLGDVGVAYSTCGDSDCGGSSLEYGPALPMTYLDFPLQKGKTWSSRLDAEYMGDADEGVVPPLDWHVEAEVAGPRTLDLEIGSTDTMQVDFTFTPVDLEAWKDAIVAEAEMHGIEVDSFEYSAAIQDRVHYGIDYQMPVFSETRSVASLAATGTDEDGEHFENAATATFVFREELVGARLVPKPERDLHFIDLVLGGRLPVTDPTGDGFRAADYSVQVSPQFPVVNVADGESVEFAAQVLGVDALPEGHTLQWRVLDGDLGVALEGEGASFSFTPADPGAYSIELEARDAEGIVAATDGTTLAANFEGTVPAACNPVNAFFVMDAPCESMGVPVELGIRHLVVEALVNPVVDPLSSGTLHLADALGHEESADQGSSGAYTIDVSDFAPWEVGGDEWTLTYDPDVGLLEEVTYHVVLRYDAAGAPVPEPDAGAWWLARAVEGLAAFENRAGSPATGAAASLGGLLG